MMLTQSACERNKCNRILWKINLSNKIRVQYKNKTKSNLTLKWSFYKVVKAITVSRVLVKLRHEWQGKQHTHRHTYGWNKVGKACERFPSKMSIAQWRYTGCWTGYILHQWRNRDSEGHQRVRVRCQKRKASCRLYTSWQKIVGRPWKSFRACSKKTGLRKYIPKKNTNLIFLFYK